MTEHARDQLAAEALKLVASLQEWATRAAADAPMGHAGPECQWCPLCQFVAVLRGERPDLTEKVAEAGVAVAGALRGFLDAAVGAADAGGGAHRAPDEPDDVPPGRVQHIDLGPTG